MQPEADDDLKQKLERGLVLVRTYAHSIGSAARHAGVSYDRLRNYLNPDERKRLQRVANERYLRRKALGLVRPRELPTRTVASRPIVPGDILAERDKAMNQPRSLTAHLMGDPAPGRSALDRRAAE